MQPGGQIAAGYLQPGRDRVFVESGGAQAQNFSFLIGHPDPAVITADIDLIILLRAGDEPIFLGGLDALDQDLPAGVLDAQLAADVADESLHGMRFQAQDFRHFAAAVDVLVHGRFQYRAFPVAEWVGSHLLGAGGVRRLDPALLERVPGGIDQLRVPPFVVALELAGRDLAVHALEHPAVEMAGIRQVQGGGYLRQALPLQDQHENGLRFCGQRIGRPGPHPGNIFVGYPRDLFEAHFPGQADQFRKAGNGHACPAGLGLVHRHAELAAHIAQAVPDPQPGDGDPVLVVNVPGHPVKKPVEAARHRLGGHFPQYQAFLAGQARPDRAAPGRRGPLRGRLTVPGQRRDGSIPGLKIVP